MTERPPRPVTYGVDIDHAMATLGHREMLALAGMFERWALTEEKFDGDQRTRLIEMSADMEAVAAWVGPQWRATDPAKPESLLAFIARKELEALGDEGGG